MYWETLAVEVGTDGAALLEAIYAVDAAAWLREIPAVQILRHVWVQNYVPTATGLRWRTRAHGLPPAARYIGSLHDLDAHFGRRRSISWIGYKLHVTGICEPEAPHLVTHVETTTAPVADGTITPNIPCSIAGARAPPSRASGRHRRRRCPITREQPAQVCPSRTLCLNPLRRTKYMRRTLTVRTEDQYRALQASRQRQTTPEFAALYGLRAGIEGTISQVDRACGVRRSRYIGQPKTHLAHVLTAVAINLQRIDAWLTDTPSCKTRHSAFARLMAAAT